MRLSADTVVPFIAEIFARRGAEEYLGEPVTIAEHSLQCAELAQSEGASDVLVAAALLHDVGHFTHEFETNAAEHGVDTVHEEAGARIIDRFFPKLVTDCVRYHVAAKRYLCATDPDYFAKLSDASVHSLKLQGGPMSAAEVEAFAKHPHLDPILNVRLWDDVGKDPNHTAPPFSHFAPILDRVVQAHRISAAAS